jgi:crossover junction endodeoxyribonuclease RuvC
MITILGIDPGSRITGYGLIKQIGQKIEYLDSGCIRTAPDDELSQKLLKIYNGICDLMDQYAPQEVAIEQVFMHQNPSSALKLGQARGAALVAAASHRISVSEYSARAIKQTVVGYGAAEKVQVGHMVVHLLSLNSTPQSDAADALAIAICHSHMRHQMVHTVRRGINLRRKTR